MTPRISVVMPVYNCARFLREAVESLLAQTVADFELVAIDDGSQDGSAEILEAFAVSDVRITIFRQDHAGVARARNVALKQVRSELVASLDADDVADPNWLNAEYEYLRTHPECVVVGCRILSMDADGDPMYRERQALSHEEIEESLLRGCGGIINSGCMMRRRAALAVGGYNESLTVGEDVDLFLKLGEQGTLANVPDCLVRVRRNFDSVCWRAVDQHVTAREQVVADACRRRGLDFGARPKVTRPPTTSPEEERLRWSMLAAYDGFYHTARKHAFGILKSTPWSLVAWKAAIRVLLYQAGLRKPKRMPAS